MTRERPCRKCGHIFSGRYCKPCSRKRSAEYYRANREVVLKRARAAYAANPEPLLEKNRAYRAEHGERLNRQASQRRRAKRWADPEPLRAKGRTKAKTESQRAANRAASAAWRARNPEKVRATKALNSAVAAGQVVKPLMCEALGCTKTRRLHGHHDDYSRPLEVRWLCPAHHSELHAYQRPIILKRSASALWAVPPTPRPPSGERHAPN